MAMAMEMAMATEMATAMAMAMAMATEMAMATAMATASATPTGFTGSAARATVSAYSALPSTKAVRAAVNPTRNVAMPPTFPARSQAVIPSTRDPSR
jgi:hypothetical protein